MDPLHIALLCLLVAAVLAIADLFVPSGGLLALLSLMVSLVSIYFGFRSSPSAGMMMMVIILIAIPIFVVLALRVWPYTPIGRRIILRAPAVDTAQPAVSDDSLSELIGQVGVAQNSLLPSGHVRINHRNYNALCDSGVIEAGQNVEVIAVRERNLVVVATTLPVRTNSVAQTETKPRKLGESLLDRPPEDLGLDSLEG